MTADLIARLRRADEYEPLGHVGWEAADRIAALEAKLARMEEVEREQKGRQEAAVKLMNKLTTSETNLAECEARLGKAVETLNRIAHKNVHEDVFSRIAQETLAELKGSKNDR